MTKVPRSWVNPIALWLRRHTIPDLAPYGLPIPEEPPGTTFLRKWMIPILDVGIVDAVRSGQVVVVPAVERFEGLKGEAEEAEAAAAGDRQEDLDWSGEVGEVGRFGAHLGEPLMSGAVFAGVSCQLKAEMESRVPRNSDLLP